MEVKNTKNWQKLLINAIAIIGVLLVVIGLISNWIYMGQELTVISFLSLIYAHWSFWLIFTGVILLTMLFIILKICRKNAQKD